MKKISSGGDLFSFWRFIYLIIIKKSRMNWERLREDTACIAFEDPITGFSVPKDLFESMYAEFLHTMDGEYMDACMEFYYADCPVMQGVYRFVDDDARLDFISGCQEYNLILDFNTICQGESKEEKRTREERKYKQEIAMEKQRLKHGREKEVIKARSEFRKRQQLESSFGKLSLQLKNVDKSNPKYEKLHDKIQRIVRMLEHSV